MLPDVPFGSFQSFQKIPCSADARFQTDSLSTLMLTTASVSRKSRLTAPSSGIARLQFLQFFPQKSSRTHFPRKSEIRTVFPCGSTNASSGAGEPTFVFSTGFRKLRISIPRRVTHRG